MKRSSRILVCLVLWAAVTACRLEDARLWLAARVGVEAVYLPFEHGFMVRVSGADCLYAYAGGIILPREVVTAYNTYRYCLPFADLPEAPPGAPVEPFGRVWSRYAEVRDTLGMATGEAVRYRASMPPSDPVIMGGVFFAGVLTLPDGSALYCGMRAATAGTCQIRPR
ncbi:MAG: hypothetical protein IT323_15255 [Anaerolineae bacterium]|nr:hypothetical protein [Anaerolineae bacterium]